MPFIGEFEHRIDDKCRLAIPAKYRVTKVIDNQRVTPNSADAQGTPDWVCMPWPTGHLRLYTGRQFDELFGQRRQSLTPGEVEAGLDTRVFSLCSPLDVDGQGRVTLPKRHLERVGFKADMPVMVVGAGVRLEVWDRTKWNSEDDDWFKRLPDMIARTQSPGA